MSRKIKFRTVKDLWDGYYLTEEQQLKLTSITREEFLLPVSERRSADQLVLEVRNKIDLDELF